MKTKPKGTELSEGQFKPIHSVSAPVPNNVARKAKEDGLSQLAMYVNRISGSWLQLDPDLAIVAI